MFTRMKLVEYEVQQGGVVEAAHGQLHVPQQGQTPQRFTQLSPVHQQTRQILDDHVERGQRVLSINGHTFQKYFFEVAAFFVLQSLLIHCGIANIHFLLFIELKQISNLCVYKKIKMFKFYCFNLKMFNFQLHCQIISAAININYVAKIFIFCKKEFKLIN